MRKIELEIVALSHSITKSQNFAVVLGEAKGSRRLPIVIGQFEAQALAIAMERLTPTRPLTHDLFKNTLEIFEIKLQEIIINRLHDGIFYSIMVCEQNGNVLEIDARTSDALAMSVRFNCPIYTYESILERAGIVLESPASTKSNPEQMDTDKSEQAEESISLRKTNYADQTIDELNELLADMIQKENYEEAAKIRDEINKRK